MRCCKSCCSGGDSSEEKDPSFIELPDPDQARTMSVVQMSSFANCSKNMYAVAVTVMQNFIGQPSYPFLTHPKQLYPYILFLCGSENALPIKDPKANEIARRIQLTVIIKEGQTIHPKYSDFSRIYCKIWVERGKEMYTTPKDTNIDLIWDEVFKFDVPEYETNVIMIEIWASRPKVLNKYNNAPEKLKVDSNSIFPGNYKIGDIEYPVRDVPCVGKHLLLPVKKGPRRLYTRGELKIFVQLSTKKGIDKVFHIYMHMEIIKLCYEKQLPSLEELTLFKNWLEILPNTALTLIQQHALQNGINPTEQCVCSWLVASSLKIREEERISFQFLNVLLDGLITDILADKVEPYLEEALFESVGVFSDHSIEMLQNLHTNFEVLIVEKADELFYLLRCMTGAELKSYGSYLDSFEIIAEEARYWYLSIISKYKEDLKVEESRIQKICVTLKKIVKIFLRNQIILDGVFKRAWSVSYSSITYKQLDLVFHDAIKPIILHIMVVMRNPDRNRIIQESLKMLQLYHNVRNLVSYVITGLPAERVNLCMDEYSSWFGDELILEWFLLCDAYTTPFIKRAVMIDSMERINKSIPHGTSIPDVTSIIDEMVLDVWLKLKWEEQFNTHGALIEAVKVCVLKYATEILKKIKSENFFCEKYPFFMNTKLCVALSNAFVICEQMQLTKQKIRSALKEAETEYGFKVIDPLQEVELELQLVVCEIYHTILNEINELFKKFTRKILIGASGSTTSRSMIVADTCSYVESVLEMLYTNLKPAAFHIVLRQLWMMAVINFRDGLSFFRGWALFICGRKSVYMHALQAISQLKEIFFCEGHGLSYTELKNQVYEELKEKIEQKLKIKN